MPCPSHPPWLGHSNYTWRRVQVKQCATQYYYAIVQFHIQLRQYTPEGIAQSPKVAFVFYFQLLQ
jgi:hypothetical protein